MAEQMAPPGWYPDSVDTEMVRWWDGAQWTAQTQTAIVPDAPAAPAPLPPPPAGYTPPAAVAPAVATPAPIVPLAHKHRFFGGKHELEEEVARLRAVVEGMGVNEQAALRAEVARLNAELPALHQEEATLLASLTPLRAELSTLKTEQEELTVLRAEVGVLDNQSEGLKKEIAKYQDILTKIPALQAELAELETQVVETRDTVILQEVGVYQYRHPLDDSPAYKSRRADLQAQIKSAVKTGTAVVGSTNWTVNGSSRDGARMVKEFSKLMLRAYNNECDNAVRSMRPYALDSAIARLTKAKDTITKLGKTMNIQVTPRYHQLRVTELELTADYLAKVAEEKEEARAQRAQERDDEKARKELQALKDKHLKTQAHYEEVAAQYRAQGEHDKAAEADAKVEEAKEARASVELREANIRTGWVYVISNVGSFGPDVVKIGMTRRPDPMDRIHELGDASVPFHYDVHGKIDSPDAVSLETYLHQKFSYCRINLVNRRREFFRVSPAEVRDAILERGEEIVSWDDECPAVEWQQSEYEREHLTTSPSS